MKNRFLTAREVSGLSDEEWAARSEIRAKLEAFDAVAQGPKSMTFAALVEHVHRINSWERRITCVVHPDASGVVESERFGNIRTERGPAGYYVSLTEKAKNENGEELPFVSHRTEKVAL